MLRFSWAAVAGSGSYQVSSLVPTEPVDGPKRGTSLSRNRQRALVPTIHLDRFNVQIDNLLPNDGEPVTGEVRVVLNPGRLAELLDPVDAVGAATADPDAGFRPFR